MRRNCRRGRARTKAQEKARASAAAYEEQRSARRKRHNRAARKHPSRKARMAAFVDDVDRINAELDAQEAEAKRKASKCCANKRKAKSMRKRARSAQWAVRNAERARAAAPAAEEVVCGDEVEQGGIEETRDVAPMPKVPPLPEGAEAVVAKPLLLRLFSVLHSIVNCVARIIGKHFSALLPERPPDTPLLLPETLPLNMPLLLPETSPSPPELPPPDPPPPPPELRPPDPQPQPPEPEAGASNLWDPAPDASTPLLIVQRDGEPPRLVAVQPRATVGELRTELGLDENDRLVLKGGPDLAPHYATVGALVPPGSRLEVVGRLEGGIKRAADDAAEKGEKAEPKPKKEPKTYTVVTGLGRSILGPADETLEPFRDCVLAELEHVLIAARVLQWKSNAAGDVWVDGLWEHEFRNFNVEAFQSTFRSKLQSRSFGHGLMVVAGGKLESGNKNVPAALVQAVVEVNKIFADAVPVATPVAGADAELQAFLAQVVGICHRHAPGDSLHPFAESIGINLRNHWRAIPQRARMNHLKLAVERDLQDHAQHVPEKVRLP